MAIDLSFFRSESSQRLRAEGKADAVVQVLEERGITVTAEARQRIHACTDTETLSRWLTRALAATTAQDLFAGS
ncbi:hypothetical protein [Streptomyces sp. NBC_01012]|uniref:hypothetical protein n=1 Tax=Streptomyces sp. NBC_01012 TaxID=2903717 RepID=UPI00386A8C74|nr:hypothetical protein OG623_13585 [Streptomyces sp. NBC_01012]